MRIKHKECFSLAFWAQNLWLVLWLRKNWYAGPELPLVSAGSFWLLTGVRSAQEPVSYWAVTPEKRSPGETFRWHCSGGPERYSRVWGPKFSSSPEAPWAYVGHLACGYSFYSSDADNSKHLPYWAHHTFQVVCVQNGPETWGRPSDCLSLPAESITQKTQEYPRLL